jgi:putative Holliday junction resolvase
MSNRVLGVDLGTRRVGLAISDATGTLARPLHVLAVRSPADALDQVVDAITRLAAEDDGLAAIVVGVPSHLDGSATSETTDATRFVVGLRERVGLLVTTSDERLSSREAESRLAVRYRDWRARKARLDAAAAAVILQDYLDGDRAAKGCMRPIA